MKIVVIGGTGLIGSKAVAILRRGGHEVVAASPKSGVNSLTGEGVKEAVAGTQVVVDLANSPSFEDKAVLAFFETSGRNLLPAEAAAGVRHHVALSIVGTDRTPDNGYFRAKVAQEKLIVAAGIPYTIVRSTQFLEFLRGIAAEGTDGNKVRISPGLFQPIAADDVAALVAEVAQAPPRNGIVEIAGPERAPLEASSPDGRSTASTNAPASWSCTMPAMARASSPFAGGAKPVPSTASTTTPASPASSSASPSASSSGASNHEPRRDHRRHQGHHRHHCAG